VAEAFAQSRSQVVKALVGKKQRNKLVELVVRRGASFYLSDLGNQSGGLGCEPHVVGSAPPFSGGALVVWYPAGLKQLVEPLLLRLPWPRAPFRAFFLSSSLSSFGVVTAISSWAISPATVAATGSCSSLASLVSASCATARRLSTATAASGEASASVRSRLAISVVSPVLSLPSGSNSSAVREAQRFSASACLQASKLTARPWALWLRSH
jgi:hypothetical protein